MKYINKNNLITNCEIEHFVNKTIKPKRLFNWEVDIIDFDNENITDEEFTTKLGMRDFANDNMCIMIITCNDFNITIECNINGETTTYTYDEPWMDFVHNLIKCEERKQMAGLPLLKKMCRVMDKNALSKQYKRDCIEFARDSRKNKSQNDDSVGVGQ